MVEHIVRKNKQNWKTFELSASSSLKLSDFFDDKMSFDQISDLANDMIIQHQLVLTKWVDQIVQERLCNQKDYDGSAYETLKAQNVSANDGVDDMSEKDEF